MTPEGYVKREVDKVLALCGKPTWWFKPVQSGYGKRALDYVGCLNGRFFAVETKAPGEKLTQFQRLTCLAMHQSGAAVFIVSTTEGVQAFARWVGNVK